MRRPHNAQRTMPFRAYGHFVAFAPRSSFRRESSVVMAGERGQLGDELATVNPLVGGGQRNLGLTSDSSQFVCHRIECAQRV
jgi:hypothetical protein